jgi:hypothetical protein
MQSYKNFGSHFTSHPKAIPSTIKLSNNCEMTVDPTTQPNHFVALVLGNENSDID